MKTTKISVCMATYNGERWVDIQVKSILEQLGPQDELVIVDDCSGDGTVDKIRSIVDGRIVLSRNEANKGVVATFESALRRAGGDILFLSDQDDVWLPGKVEKIVAVFESRPDVTLVVSDAQIIDGDGQVVKGSFFAGRGRFVDGVVANLIKNKYLGCTMAFRRSLMNDIVPFPRSIPMHDMWIGILNAIYGRAHFIDEPLVGYRRHTGNASPQSHRAFATMLRWRLQLAMAIAVRVGRGLWCGRGSGGA